MLFQSPQRLKTRYVERQVCVFAYDIACPKRARRVRRSLACHVMGGQYSVIETFLRPSERSDLLAELISQMDLEQDVLATWAPRRGQRVQCSGHKLIASTISGVPGVNTELSQTLGSGNLMLCYDIRDEERLRAVAALVAAHCVYVQRSVYWLRGSFKQASALLIALVRLITPDDWVWAYPLSHAGDLWRWQAAASSLLPCTTTLPRRT